MEFNEKLQELRKQKGLTQEALAEALYVSRTAISKWESGRGYPSIDSLKAIAAFFSVTVDELLSGEELLSIAEENTRQKENRLRDLVFGLLDCSAATFFFLPLFGQQAGDIIEEVSLLALTQTESYLQAGYFVIVIGMVVMGLLTLALQNYQHPFWVGAKGRLSLLLNTAGVVLLIAGRQPYATLMLFIFLVIKALMLIRWK